MDLKGKERISKFSIDRHSLLFNSQKRSSKKLKLFQNFKFNGKDEALKIIISKIMKDKKTIDDIKEISLFLQSSKCLNDMLEKANSKNNFTIFNKLASSLKYEMKNSNQMLFRYGKILFNLGDQNVKFYTILKGSVSILIPSEVEMEMTRNDFNLYLKKLSENNELEITQNVLNSNLKENTFNSLQNSNSQDKNPINDKNLKTFKDDFFIREDYIDNLKPVINQINNEEKIKFIIWEYVFVKTLYSGEIVDDNLLSSSSQIRYLSNK